MTPDQHEQRAVRLFHELAQVRERAKLLPYYDMERWTLSIRAGKISAELKASLAQSRPAS